ncbi:MAG: hypothetical protein ACYSYL_00110 [Planctomycetota bacterium]
MNNTLRLHGGAHPLSARVATLVPPLGRSCLSTCAVVWQARFPSQNSRKIHTASPSSRKSTSGVVRRRTFTPGGPSLRLASWVARLRARPSLLGTQGRSRSVSRCWVVTTRCAWAVCSKLLAWGGRVLPVSGLSGSGNPFVVPWSSVAT